MKQGNIYFTFEGLKEIFKEIPSNAFLKNIEADNPNETITVTFYVSEETKIKEGAIYTTFNALKKEFNFPEDALFKYIDVNNLEGSATITFYTNDDNYYNLASGAVIPRKNINNL